MPTFINEVSLTFTSNFTWQTVDLSAQVPVNAAAVFVKLKNNAHYSYTVLCRSGSSTQTFSTQGGHGGSLRDYVFSYQVVKLSASRTIEVLAESGAGGQVVLYGYLTSDEIAATDTMSSFTVPTTGWNTVDLTSYIPGGIKAYSVIIQCMGTPDLGSGYAFSPIGGTYGTSYCGGSQAYCGTSVMTLSNNQLQVYSGNHSYSLFYIVGFIKKDIVTCYSSPIDKSSLCGVYPTYNDISTLPTGAIAGIYNNSGDTAYQTCGIKAKGSSPVLAAGGEDYGGHACPAIPTGTANVVQGSKNYGKILEIGYWHKPSSNQLFSGVHF